MICSSFSFPNMFDVSRNSINLYTDAHSITNRVKLLLLTEPTELYMNPNFGVGLKKYMFTYNNDNTIALIRDKLVEQLMLWEPAVIPEQTKITRGNTYTEGVTSETVDLNLNTLKITVTLTTSYMQVISFDVTGQDILKLSQGGQQ